MDVALKRWPHHFNRPSFSNEKDKNYYFAQNWMTIAFLFFFFYDDMLAAPTNSLNLQQLHSINVQSMNLTWRSV